MDAWLRCELSVGQFKNEVAVRLQDFAGEAMSLFVPLSTVRTSKPIGEQWTQGALKVSILDSDQGHHLILLPSQTFSNGQTITVRDDQLDRNGTTQRPLVEQ